MAAAIGDVEWLKQSLKDSGSSIKYDKNGFAAIHLAAIHGRLSCLKICIEKFRTDINLPSSTGWRAIHLCISKQTGKRSLECLAYLLEKGADCSVSNEDGITPVHQAASEGHVDCLKMLLAANAKFDVKDCRGNTPLNLAKLWGHRQCARILASGIWNEDKDFFAKEMHQLKKIKMQRVLREFEAEEQMKEIRQFLGNEAFTQWAINKNIVQKLPKQSEEQNITIQRECVYKPKSISRTTKETESHDVTKLKLLTNLRKASDETNIIRDEKVGDKPFTGLQSKKKDKYSSEQSVKWSKDSVVDTLKSTWNISTKATLSQYIPNLDDSYPRDEYTVMPRVKGVPRFYEGRFVHPLTPDSVDENIRMKCLASKLRKPRLPEQLINSELSTVSNDRGMIFKPKHMDDIHMKKKFDIKGHTEVPLHLSNDINSHLVQNSVRVGHTAPKYIGSKSYNSSPTITPERTDGNVPLPLIMETLKNMSKVKNV
ncbi:hypothetical protein BsWGS_04413 [Bradybaena similaris]